MARKLDWNIQFGSPMHYSVEDNKNVPDTCESDGEVFKLKQATITIIGLDKDNPKAKTIVRKLSLMTDKDNRNFVYLKDESRQGDKNHWTKLGGFFNKKVRNAIGKQIIAQYNDKYDKKFQFKEDDRVWAGNQAEAVVTGLQLEV